MTVINQTTDSQTHLWNVDRFFLKSVLSKFFILLGPVRDLKAFLARSRCNIFLAQLEKKNLARVSFFKVPTGCIILNWSKLNGSEG